MPNAHEWQWINSPPYLASKVGTLQLNADKFGLAWRRDVAAVTVYTTPT